MYVLNGHLRISYADPNMGSITCDSLRAEVTSVCNAVPQESDYCKLGAKLLSKLGSMLHCQLGDVSTDDTKVLMKIDADFKEILIKHKRGTSRTYKFSKAMVRVSLRLRESSVDSSKIYPELVYTH